MRTKLFLISLLTLLGSITANAITFEVDGIKYSTLTDNTVEVISQSPRYSGSITIPFIVTYRNVTYSVTSIGQDAFYACTGLTSINIPNSVRRICYGAFSYCTGLTSIEIPNSVTIIGDYAFQGCTGLTSVTIGTSVTSIGDYAFQGCNRILFVALNCSDVGTWFQGFTSINNVYLGDKVKTIAEKAFSGCTGLTSVTINSNSIASKSYSYGASLTTLFGTQVEKYIIGETVTIIGRYAFSGSTGLTSITIPNSVIRIDEYAFHDCTGLTSVNISDIESWCRIIFKEYSDNGIYEYSSNPLFYAHHLYLNGEEVKELVIPNRVMSIGNYAFKGCTDLTSVTIGSSVTSIGKSAFSDCTGLTSVTIGNNVTSIEQGAFAGCSGLTSVTIGNGVTSIGERVFDGCIRLTSVTIPNSVTSIEDFAFMDCLSLNSVIIPNSVTYLSGFNGCTSLTSVSIPTSVTSIGSGAFCGCSNLTSIEIPNSVTSIGDYAFQECTSLISIEIPNSVTSIEWGCFYGCSGLTSVTIGNSVTSIGINAFSCCTGLTSIEIPSSVTVVNATAFDGCTSINNVIIEDSEIPLEFSYDGADNDGLFYGCPISSLYLGRNIEGIDFDQNSSYLTPFGINSLKKISIGNNVTSINPFDFFGSTISSIVVDKGNPKYDSRDNSDAIIETATNTIIMGCMNTNIPNSVTRIGDSAFRGCMGLTTIEIPNTVNTIGWDAFFGCVNLSNLIIKDGDIPLNFTGFERFTQSGSPGGINDCPITTLYLGRNIGYKVHEDMNSNVTNSCSWFTLLKKLIIGNQVTYIGRNEFNFCRDLTSVISRIEKPFVFGESAFYYISENCKLIVPYGTRNAYIAAGWTNNVFRGGVYEESAPLLNNIAFADANVKALCVANWDTNSDGELSKAEAAAVTDLGEVFKGNTEITSFNELQYFTKLTIIGAYAFHMCSNLKSLTIPNSVISIGKGAFDGADISTVISLIEIPSAIYDKTSDYKSFSLNTFNNATLYVPKGTISKYTATMGWKDFTNIVEGTGPNGDEEDAVVINGIYYNLINEDGIAEVIENPNKYTGDVVIPKSVTYKNVNYNVTSIGEGAFSGCSGLTSITIPNSVKSMGKDAFLDCI